MTSPRGGRFETLRLNHWKWFCYALIIRLEQVCKIRCLILLLQIADIPV